MPMCHGFFILMPMPNNIPILHVDGSLSHFLDKQKQIKKIAGGGGYLVINGKIQDKFFRQFENIPFIEHHEEHSIIEGMKWVQSKNIKEIKIKTDSLYAVNLFSSQKKAITAEDKFFLLQYLMLECFFDYVEISYHSRDNNDLSHILSRTYMKNIPKELEKIDSPCKLPPKPSNPFDIPRELKFIMNKQIIELVQSLKSIHL